MMKRRLLLGVAGAAALNLAMATTGRAEPEDCPVPHDSLEVLVKLPHLAERLRDGKPVTIVALGGGSTKGAAAGAPDLAYPHRLQVALAAFYPGVPITVVNKGVPRQSAQQMVARFPADVMALHPSLVVWETGISDAVRGIELDDFATSLQVGIDELKKQAIDILLVDMQFSRSASAVINFEGYLRTLHRVGALNEVYVFPRFEMMRYWSEHDVFNFEDVADAERARLAAKVYECIGRKLAQAIRIAAR
jgi:acyl-CoA thioesterase I